MPTLGIGWEILAIDDGSRDSTGSILDSLKDVNVRVFHHDVNRGQAAAMKTGFTNASGDVVITIDSDLSFPLFNMKNILKAARKSDADALIGIAPYNKDVPKHRKMIGNMGNLIYNLVFPIKLRQYTCNFRLYRSDVARDLEFDAESRFVGKVSIIADLMRKKRKIEQIEVIPRPRKGGKSKFRVSDVFIHFRFALRIVGMRLSGEFR
jgi:dolichol-phosphate mannosyltransferase